MILCIGTTPTFQRTLVFERLTLDDVNRAITCDDYASGKSINVARVARLIGAEVVETGFVGGIRGGQLRDSLSQDGIVHDFVEAAVQTRLCTTVIDKARGTVTELVEESAAVERPAWERLRRKVAHWMKMAKVCVLSGSLPPDGDEDFYADVIATARRQGVLTILDTRGRPLLRALREDGFIVKLNRSELATTAGRTLRGDAGLRRAMREVCPVGGQVIVTMGGEGAMAWDGTTFWRIPAPKVKAINPIGSGDSFAAGLAVALSRGQKPEKAYALAAVCGAANAMHPRAGYVDRKVVTRIAGGVRIKAI
ncbi:1-phosphofructokinase family hexose kinase [Humisphaera borealis]|uniref:Hexose kinase n=1 Tax=Humisphaera borealis TaxID=2807512 RepID=A0A7M2WRH1_9BACT|nr:hexose kinase [Humisphaera borealis]QOV88127.1 hexose kinase [Humisphaera borealis]